jgi:hypothetical protein
MSSPTFRVSVAATVTLLGFSGSADACGPPFPECELYFVQTQNVPANIPAFPVTVDLQCSPETSGCAMGPPSRGGWVLPLALAVLGFAPGRWRSPERRFRRCSPS